MKALRAETTLKMIESNRERGRSGDDAGPIVPREQLVVDQLLNAFGDHIAGTARIKAERRRRDEDADDIV